MTPKHGFTSRDDFDRWCSRHLPPGSYSMERVETILNVLRDMIHPSQFLKNEVSKLKESMESEPEVVPAEPAEVMDPEGAPKPKKEMSPAKKQKFARYRERVRQRRKAARIAARSKPDTEGSTEASSIEDEIRQAMDQKDVASLDDQSPIQESEE